MKNYISIVLLFVCTLAFGQIKVDAVDFQGKVTSTVRDGMTVPTNNARLIWNSTTERFEYAQDDEVWLPLGLTYTAGTGLTLTGNEFSVDFGAAGFGNYVSRLAPINLVTPSAGDSWEIRYDFNSTARGTLLLDNGSASIRSENPVSGAYGQFFTSSGLGSYTLSDGVTPVVWDFDSAYNSNTDIARKVNVDAAIAAANQTLSLSGTDLSISNGNTVDLSGLGGGGTDDQTLSEVLTQGNTANTSINMNANFIDNADYLRFRDSNADTRRWLIVESNVTGYEGDIAFANGPFPSDKMYIPLDGVIDQPLHAVTKAYADATYATSAGALTADQLLELSNRGQSKDSLVSAAVDSLALDLATWQAGSDKYKTKVLRKNNGRLNLFPPSDFASIPNGTMWRGFTAAANDTIAIPSANGVVVRFEGQSSSNAGYVTGEWGEFWAKKISNDTLRVSSPNIVGYTYTPPVVGPTNLYPAGNIASPTPNEANAYGGWTTGLRTALTTIYRTNGDYGYMGGNTNNASFSSQQVDITGLNSSLATTVTMDVVQIQGTSGAIRIAEVGTSTTMTGVTGASNPYNLNDDQNFQTITYNIPSGVTGFRIRLVHNATNPNNNDSIIDPGEEWIGIDNIIVTQE